MNRQQIDENIRNGKYSVPDDQPGDGDALLMREDLEAATRLTGHPKAAKLFSLIKSNFPHRLLFVFVSRYFDFAALLLDDSPNQGTIDSPKED